MTHTGVLVLSVNVSEMVQDRDYCSSSGRLMMYGLLNGMNTNKLKGDMQQFLTKLMNSSF